MKFLLSNKKNFDRDLSRLLELRKNKIKGNSKSVVNIIKDVKKMVSKHY